MRQSRQSTAKKKKVRYAVVGKKRDQFAPELVYFSDCILNDEEPAPSGREGLADVRIIRAILEAAEIDRPVSLPQAKIDRRPELGQEILGWPPVAPS